MEPCRVNSSATWHTAVASNECTLWPASGLGVVWVIYPSIRVNDSIDMRVWDTTCGNSTFGSSKGFYDVPPDGTCIFPMPPVNVASLFIGVRARLLAPYVYSPPVIDYAITQVFAGSRTCSGRAAALVWQSPACTAVASSSFNLMCTNATSGINMRYGTSDCSGLVVSGSAVSFPSGCTPQQGVYGSLVGSCIGPGLGYPAVTPPTSGWLTTRYAGSCAVRGAPISYTRAPLGTCFPVEGAYAFVTCGTDAAVLVANHAAADCSDTPVMERISAGCVDGSSPLEVTQVSECLLPSPPPPPPLGYVRMPADAANSFYSHSFLAPGKARIYIAPYAFTGTNGDPPLVVTASLYNPTRATVRLRATGGFDCAAFPDADYNAGVNDIVSNASEVALVNLRCVTPAPLIEPGKLNRCCAEVACVSPGGCAYLELTFVQYEAAPPQAGAAGASLGAIIGGVAAAGLTVSLALWGLRRAGVFRSRSVMSLAGDDGTRARAAGVGAGALGGGVVTVNPATNTMVITPAAKAGASASSSGGKGAGDVVLAWAST